MLPVEYFIMQIIFKQGGKVSDLLLSPTMLFSRVRVIFKLAEVYALSTSSKYLGHKVLAHNTHFKGQLQKSPTMKYKDSIYSRLLRSLGVQVR